VGVGVGFGVGVGVGEGVGVGVGCHRQPLFLDRASTATESKRIIANRIRKTLVIILRILGACPLRGIQ
jgi:hypothetical protein